jgi:glutamate dehydrogenase/leucine dehydrogenase
VPSAVFATSSDWSLSLLRRPTGQSVISLLRAVAGGANNQLADPKDAERLRARGIVYAPDFVINSGGAIAILGLETQGWTRERAEKEVVETIRRALQRIFRAAAVEGITTEAAASQIAEERLSGQEG